MKCPVCYSPDYVKKGLNDCGSQRYKCKSCGHRFTDSTAIAGRAKILLFDIETQPLDVYVWNLFPKYIHIQQIVDDWSIIGWRAKWLFGTDVMGSFQTPEEAVMRDDARVTKDLWSLIDEADILIAHNLIDFDLKKANTQFLMHGMKPPSPFQTIDTLKVARREFKVSSNKLDYLCQKLGIGAKLDTGFELWRDCLGGEPIEVSSKRTNNKIVRTETFDAKLVASAIDHMSTYCKRDVTVLEELYLKLRPWIKSHPNLALYCEDNEGRCGNCGSDNLMRTHRSYYTPTGKYEVWRCGDCEAMVRSRFQGKDSDLLRTLAR